MNPACQDISAIRWPCHMATASNAPATHRVPSKPNSACRYVTRPPALAVVNPMSSVAIVMNVKMDISTLYLAMAARAATAIPSVASIHRANVLLVNVTANRASLGKSSYSHVSHEYICIHFHFFHFVCAVFVVINALRINMVSRLKAASHATVTQAAPKDSNATNTVNVRVTTMSKVVVATAAKRTNTTVIKAV